MEQGSRDYAKASEPRQGYHSWNFAHGEILEMRLRLIASAVGFGGPLIAGFNGLRLTDP